MPTPTEIKDPRMTYCKLKEEHCLCAKCGWENACSHNCELCKEMNSMSEKEMDLADVPMILREMEAIKECDRYCKTKEEAIEIARKYYYTYKTKGNNANSY